MGYDDDFDWEKEALRRFEEGQCEAERRRLLSTGNLSDASEAFGHDAWALNAYLARKERAAREKNVSRQVDGSGTGEKKTNGRGRPLLEESKPCASVNLFDSDGIDSGGSSLVVRIGDDSSVSSYLTSHQPLEVVRQIHSAKDLKYLADLHFKELESLREEAMAQIKGIFEKYPDREYEVHYGYGEKCGEVCDHHFKYFSDRQLEDGAIYRVFVDGSSGIITVVTEESLVRVPLVDVISTEVVFSFMAEAEDFNKTSRHYFGKVYFKNRR